jgi:hypothetical protein
MPVPRRPERSAAGWDGEVPEWVLDGGSYVAAIRRLAQRPDVAEARSVAVLHAEARRNSAAAEAWCAARGLSYVMTVSGSARPTAAEEAEGRMWGAGPKHERTQRYLREHR